MKNRLDERIVIVVLGMISIVLVIGVSEVIRRYSSGPGEKAPTKEYEAQFSSLTDSVLRLESDFNNFRPATERKITELEAKLSSLEQTERKITELEAKLSSLEQGVGSSSNVKGQPPTLEERVTREASREQTISDALARAQGYLAKGQFVETEHTALLDSLLQLYAIKGLTPEQNKALLATIQMMNELNETN